jgi:hypothetical protein
MEAIKMQAPFRKIRSCRRTIICLVHKRRAQYETDEPLLFKQKAKFVVAFVELLFIAGNACPWMTPISATTTLYFFKYPLKKNNPVEFPEAALGLKRLECN